jgi:hypothetical protein
VCVWTNCWVSSISRFVFSFFVFLLFDNKISIGPAIRGEEIIQSKLVLLCLYVHRPSVCVYRRCRCAESAKTKSID